jgi:DNA repair protein RecO (recombination protein O)
MGRAERRGIIAPVPRAARVYRTEAIILRRSDLGETDRLLTVFTPELGKLRLVAKGIRRPGSRKAGHLEPLSRSSLLIARGRELDIVAEAEAIELYPALRNDLIRLGHAAYIAELVDRFTVPEAEGRALFRLVADTFDRLASGADPASVVRHFELTLLEQSGYRPELFRCLGCGREVRPEDQYLSPEDGGVLCPDCGRARRGARPIHLASLKVLRHFQRHPIGAAVAVRIRPEVHAELERLMEGYLSYILERRLNAPRFLREVRALSPEGVESG